MNYVEYRWSHFRPSVPAQTVGETVARIEREEGSCHPARLVEAARPADSPLHPLFTWDDNEAAAKWRTHEARNVINSLEVTITRNGTAIDAPAFVSLHRPAKDGDDAVSYRSVSVVMLAPASAQDALSEALGKLNALRRRYEALTQLSGVWRALDAIAAD